MKISITTVNYYSGRFTELLFRSSRVLNPGLDADFYIYDNGSSDGSLDFCEKVTTRRPTVIPGAEVVPQGNRSHAHALDRLFADRRVRSADVVCVVDSDCFSTQENWLTGYAKEVGNGDFDAIGATAYCPSVGPGNAYLWPGFLILGRRAIRTVLQDGLSFMPGVIGGQPKDSGQLLSDALNRTDLAVRFLERTPPRKIGNVQMEKWSIDNAVDHFFAASGKCSPRHWFRYVYGDKARGTNLARIIKAWRLFRQPDIASLMSCAL